MNKAPDLCLKCAYLSILDCPEGTRLGCFNANRVETFQNDAEPPCKEKEYRQESSVIIPWNVCRTCRWHAEKTILDPVREHHFGCLALKKVLEAGMLCPCKGSSYERG